MCVLEFAEADVLLGQCLCLNDAVDQLQTIEASVRPYQIVSSHCVVCIKVENCPGSMVFAFFDMSLEDHSDSGD